MTNAETTKAWRCTVCGYVHRGESPPEFCPLCGAAASEFEALAEEAKPAAAAAPVRWSCLNCNYIHHGESPPETCPVCGAAADRFEPLGAGAGAGSASEDDLDVVIVGAGIAGLSAAEAIRENAPRARITLVSKEDALPYYRLNLTRYLAGEVERGDLPVHPAAWYEENDIRLVRGGEIQSLNLDAHQVNLHGGQVLPFRKLVLAAGAHPFMPPIGGVARDCVRALRTVEDAERILSAARDKGTCICVGGGVLGLEAAGALARVGCQVELLEGFNWLLPRQLTERAARILERHVEGLGIRLHLGVQTREVLGDERARGVELEDGQVIDGDLVLVTTGIRPNSYLARRAGLRVKHGVIVDDHLRASHPDVTAAGDVAEHQGTIYGIWAPSLYQGKIAGLNTLGLNMEFGGLPRSNTLKVLGVELFSIGLVSPEDGSYQVLDDEQDEVFYRLVFRDGTLRGAILLGDTSATSRVKKAIEDRRDLSGVLQLRPTVAECLDAIGE